MLHFYPLFTTYKLIIPKKNRLCNTKLLFAPGAQLFFLSFAARSPSFRRFLSHLLVKLPIKPLKFSLGFVFRFRRDFPLLPAFLQQKTPPGFSRTVLLLCFRFYFSVGSSRSPAWLAASASACRVVVMFPRLLATTSWLVRRMFSANS